MATTGLDARSSSVYWHNELMPDQDLLCDVPETSARVLSEILCLDNKSVMDDTLQQNEPHGNGNNASNDYSLRLHLPQLMRNVGLAFAVCNPAIEWYNSLDQGKPRTRPPFSYYYLMRKLMLAYHYPEFRGPICDVLKKGSHDAIEDYIIWRYLTEKAPKSLERAHRVYSTGLVPYDQDTPEDGPPIAAAWEFQSYVVWKLLTQRDDGIGGEMDAGWRAVNRPIRW